MIVAIEGLNGVGKSTLFRSLQGRINRPDVRFPIFKSISPALRKVQPEVNEREMLLFGSMYEADKLYISDRFFAVSSFVYALAEGREFPSAVLPWVSRTHVISLRAPLNTLVERMNGRSGKEPTPVEVLFDLALCYERVLGTMGYASVKVFDAGGRVEDYIDDVNTHLRMLHSAMRDGE